MHQRITIKDIARTVGVSPQTVSRVLNKRPDVAAETRLRIEQVIAELNYQPSAVARSLVHRRSYTLGIVTAGLSYAGPARVLQGAIKQAEQDGYTLLLKNISLSNTEIRPVLDALYASQVDGIVWAVPEVDTHWTEIYEFFLNASLPTLFLWTQTDLHLPVVTSNNYMGGALATRHLLAQGFQKIGHISGPLNWRGVRERYRGWQETLLAAGMSVNDNHWAEGDWSSESGQEALLQLLKSYPDMDALFAANDHMALGAIQVAHQRGIRIPQGLAIVGFDNIPESAYFWPPLTTVQQDWRQLGARAVQELIRMVQMFEQQVEVIVPTQTILEPELVVRESSQNSSNPAMGRLQ
jgi:LacI family transcriptional regulator